MSELAMSVEALRKIPLFQNLNDTECLQIAEICRRREVEPGEYVLEFGDTSQNLWILLEGRCAVIKPRDAAQPRGESLRLATLAPFSIFGEMSFFHQAPHSAHVRAETPLKLLCIARRDYDDLIRDGAWGAYKLAVNAVASLAERLRRMDEWVAELTRGEPLAEPAAESRSSEWSSFRDKLFASWNL